VSAERCLSCTDGLPPVKGKCIDRIPDVRVEEVFFFSYRRQTKIVWLIVFAEMLMLVVRIIIKTVEYISNIIYKRRVEQKTALRKAIIGSAFLIEKEKKSMKKNSVQLQKTTTEFTGL